MRKETYSHKQKLIDIIKGNGDCSDIYYWKGCDFCPIDGRICITNLNDLVARPLRKEEAIKIYKAYKYNIEDLFEIIL